ncbi:MAG: 30S ribosomal protein S24e [Metallosphaera sp.]|uniref:Small ribosomal subunit protein eS24 n=1 Tax=Metallosphaera cuprina (strain Ar-4) TaxID=1006006 RepID=F4FXZ7_METCR|nr:30S ribosomal protein S24e [Metallosphaera cuprina]AEB94195.1 30S ribosomal protein S24e [Metallosphaera cuprina Ar-4]
MSQSQQIKVSEKAEALVESIADNKVIGRREIRLKIYHIGSPTPSRADLKNAISNFMGARDELVVVREINTGYGAGISEARVHVYESKETLEEFEPSHLINRGTKANVQKGDSNG